jgi:uncharacterized protein
MTNVTGAADSLIQEIVDAVVATGDPEQVIVFGSAARGDAGPDSDVDLLVVEKESAFPDGSRRAESSRIRRALWRFLVPIDVLLVTPEEVDKWKDSVNHVIARSLREGKVIYDRTRGRKTVAETRPDRPEGHQ